MPILATISPQPPLQPQMTLRTLLQRLTSSTLALTAHYLLAPRYIGNHDITTNTTTEHHHFAPAPSQLSLALTSNGCGFPGRLNIDPTTTSCACGSGQFPCRACPSNHRRLSAVARRPSRWRQPKHLWTTLHVDLVHLVRSARSRECLDCGWCVVPVLPQQALRCLETRHTRSKALAVNPSTPSDPTRLASTA